MRYFTLSLLFVFLYSCSIQTVSVDYDRNHDFSQIKDFKLEWLDYSINELQQKRIQTALINEFVAKRVQYNEDSEVLITIAFQEHMKKFRFLMQE